VIAPSHQQFYQLAGNETILPLIQLHTKMILASKDLLSQPTAPGRSLYTELVEPTQNMIKKGSKVFIVGDEALSGLNFETLQTPGEGSHYWIEDVTITNALQLLSMRRIDEARFADKRILLMGDPVYRRDEYADFQMPLPKSRKWQIIFRRSPHRTDGITGIPGGVSGYQGQPVCLHTLCCSRHRKHDHST
jgi:hypothetical protein